MLEFLAFWSIRVFVTTTPTWKNLSNGLGEAIVATLQSGKPLWSKNNTEAELKNCIWTNHKATEAMPEWRKWSCLALMLSAIFGENHTEFQQKHLVVDVKQGGGKGMIWDGFGATKAGHLQWSNQWANASPSLRRVRLKIKRLKILESTSQGSDFCPIKMLFRDLKRAVIKEMSKTQWRTKLFRRMGEHNVTRDWWGLTGNERKLSQVISWLFLSLFIKKGIKSFAHDYESSAVMRIISRW